MPSKTITNYRSFDFPGALPGSRTLLTGIRETSNTGEYVITGFYEYPNSTFPTTSFVFRGTLNGNGKWYILNFPSGPGNTVASTNLYGPDVVYGNRDHCAKNERYHIVGNYTRVNETSTIGALFQGQLDGNPGKWTTIIPSPLSSDPVLNTICHSTMGNLIVGNYDTILIQGRAFIYDICSKTYYDIVKPNALSITAYGIWQISNNKYVICGGFFNIPGAEGGYLVIWNNKTKRFSHWTEYYFNNNPVKSIVTHFDGISSDGCNGFTLTGDYIEIGNEPKAFFAHVRRDCNGFSKKANWKTLAFEGTLGISGNSVSEYVVIGVYNTITDPTTVHGYVTLASC